MIRSRPFGLFILTPSCVLALSGCLPSVPATASPQLNAALLPMRLLYLGGVAAIFAVAVASLLAYRAIAAQRRREEELAQRNTILTLQQQTSLDDIIAVDRLGNVIFHNCRYRDLWEEGHSRQLAAPSFRQAIQPLLDKLVDPGAFLQIVREVADHPAERKKAQIQLKSGRVLDAYCSPSKAADGSYLGRVWYFREVTDRVEAQRALEENESLFRGLVKSAADAMVIVNASLEIVMANEQFDSMFGYGHGEVIGRKLDVLVPPRFARHTDYAKEFIRNPRRRLMGHGLELVALRKNGSEFPVEIGLSPLQTTQGLVVSAAIRDISARKAAERQLAAAAAYARSLLDACPDPIFTVSPQGTITDVNDATVRLTGLPREGLIGSGFSGRFTDPERADAVCRDVFSRGSIWDCPLAVRDRSGNPSEVLFNATVYRDRGDAVAGMFATARDMRERNKVEAELRELNRSLEERVEQRTRELLARSREVVAAAETIAEISGEIATTAHQVLASAVQTASAVTQTTATVEEVKQTALAASDTARNVTLAAQHSLAVAQGGKQAMLASTQGLQRIRDHVASGAESMARLRRQSKAIADIIASVNDLADQSNLLAVNAAIEASKAGQQGKGFAIVAREVKNLAEQSKRATSRVGAILNDIKAATDEAVRLSEQGLQAVRDGIGQAAVAEDAIVQMGGSIEASTQAAAQIAASCQQQLAGMAQVAQAVESIREASTHNIYGMNEIDATLRHLRALGEKLKQLDMRLGRTE